MIVTPIKDMKLSTGEDSFYKGNTYKIYLEEDGYILPYYTTDETGYRHWLSYHYLMSNFNIKEVTS